MNLNHVGKQFNLIDQHMWLAATLSGTKSTHNVTEIEHAPDALAKVYLGFMYGVRLGLEVR